MESNVRLARASTPSISSVLRIDVVADISCPFCFLGKKRLEQALLRLDGQSSPEISWQPLELSPEIPRQGLALDEFLMRRFGGRQTVMPALDQLQGLGRDAGIQFRFDLIDRVPNTLDAHRLIRFATLHGQQEGMVQQLYSAYFERGLDVGRREVLAHLAGEVGLSVAETRDYLRSKQGVDTVRGIEALHRRNGTNGVPIFLLNGFVSVEGAQEVDTLVKAMDFALFQAEPSSIDSGQLH